MIYLKLAYRNIRRSLRDYAIYFFTIVLSVMIFYSFNSLKDQPVVVEVCRQAGIESNIIAVLLGFASFFVAFIVAALVLYSNNFIIRRRKRELGTYLLLGMNQGAVARMLFLETLGVGAIAYLLGIFTGVLFSGLMSILFATLLEVVFPARFFTFSLYSIVLTGVFYALIFIGVGVMSSFSVSRHSLASLLAANRTNEAYKARNRWVTAILGVVSLAVLGFGYRIGYQSIASPSFNPMSPVFILVAALMVVGSFGFFYVGIGCVFALLRRIDWFRWKGLNTFTMQQILKKVNSNTLVLTAANILLAMIITSVVFLVAFQSLIKQDQAGALPYAYAVLYLEPDDVSGFDAVANANPLNPLLKKLAITRYLPDVSSSDLVLPQDADKNDSPILSFDDSCSAVGLSEYNAVRQAIGLDPVNLDEGAIAIQTGALSQPFTEKIQKAAGQGLSLNLASSSYAVGQVVSEPFVSVVSSSMCTLVVPDEAVAGLPQDGAATTLMYDYANGQDPILEENLLNEINRVGSGYWTSKLEESANLKMIQVFIMFPGLFVEIILLLACGSVLGLQQLIETVDSARHYQGLYNLGAEDRQIHRSIFQQVTFYFFVPVALAILHSLVALSAFDRLLGGAIPINLLGLWLALGGLFLVYAFYYIITWRNCVRLALVQTEPMAS